MSPKEAQVATDAPGQSLPGFPIRPRRGAEQLLQVLVGYSVEDKKAATPLANIK